MNNIINNIKANLKTFFWPYRWLLGAFLLMFCVLSELHGSSIGLYADILGHPELNTVLLGKNRPIRSDEWLVFTPFAFSQYYTGFAYFGEIVRGTLTDMFLVYGQPVWDVAMLFRPAQWGYLFLDQGSGLAFFWMGRLIVLFLVSLEFGRILTKNKYLSIAYALMLSLSPLVQWWFSVNSLVEILAVGQGMVILFHKYLSTPRKKCRLLYLLGIMWCGGIYFFAIYPAWQVSFGYVFLGLLVWTGLENKSGLAFCRQDWWAWCLGLILLIIPVCSNMITDKVAK